MGNQPERLLEDRLGVAFRDTAVLRLALTHRSFVHERPLEAPESNERLEFLGDAFLGMVIAGELYRRFPDEDEGRLTEMRSRLVRTETLASLASTLGIGVALRLGRGEEASGGRDRARNLARVFEAVVGAVFVDQGYRKGRAFVLRAFRGKLGGLDERFANYKSMLQEAVQSQGGPAPSYRTMSDAGPLPERFTVEVRAGTETATGTGSTKQQAGQAAAKAALEAMALP